MQNSYSSSLLTKRKPMRLHYNYNYIINHGETYYMFLLGDFTELFTWVYLPKFHRQKEVSFTEEKQLYKVLYTHTYILPL